MSEKINWQDPAAAGNKKPRFPNLGDWFIHSFKILFSLIFVFIAFYYMVLPQIKVNYFYASTKCLVADKQMRPLSKYTRNPGYQPEALVVYEVNKKIYTHWAYDVLNSIYTNPDAYQGATNVIKTGSYYICWYDTADPHQVVIKRGWDHISLLFFGMTLVVLLASIINFLRWYRLLPSV